MKEVSLAQLKKDFELYREILCIEVVFIVENDEQQIALVPFEAHKSFNAALPTRAFSISEFEKNLDSYRDIAQVEAAVLTDNDEPQIVMLPYADYKSLRAAMPQRAFHVSEMSDEDIKAILDAKMPASDMWSEDGSEPD